MPVSGQAIVLKPAVYRNLSAMANYQPLMTEDRRLSGGPAEEWKRVGRLQAGVTPAEISRSLLLQEPHVAGGDFVHGAHDVCAALFHGQFAFRSGE